MLAVAMMNDSATIAQRLQQIVDDIADRFSVDVCTVYVHDHQGQQLELVATRGLNMTAVGYRFPTTRGLTGKVVREKRPVSVKHPATHPDYHYVEGSGEEKLESYLGLPLMEFGNVRGAMVIQTLAPRIFKLSEIEEFYAAGKQVLAGMVVG